VASLNDIFPGENGRLLLILVMLKLRLPELMVLPRDEELDKGTEDRLERGLRDVLRSRTLRRVNP